MGVALLPALVLGWQRNLDYLKKAFAGLGLFAGIHSQAAANTVEITWIRSVSITSAMARLLEMGGSKPSHAFVLGGGIAVAFLLVVWMIYRSWNARLFAPNPMSDASGKPLAAVMAFEWLGLMVAWLAFGPEVSRRHMFVLLLFNLTALGLLAVPLSKVNKLPLIIGLVIFQLGLRLPPSNQTFAQASEFWNGIGGPSWCLLIGYASLLWTGLSVEQAMKGPTGAHDPDLVSQDLTIIGGKAKPT
jgi:hypothetical protein